jgi:hypothetical protein
LVNSALLFVLYFIYHNNSSALLANWDQPRLEAFIAKNRLSGKIYIDGPRPFFIQRAAATPSSFFYDLNPRAMNKNDVGLYSSIKQCVKPDYWILSRHLRSQADFESIKSNFREIIYDDGVSFVARSWEGKTPPNLDASDCKYLYMYG